jgi:hypothetical protein
MLLLAFVMCAHTPATGPDTCWDSIHSLCSTTNSSRRACLQCASDNAKQLVSVCADLSIQLELACGYEIQGQPTGFSCSGSNSTSVSLQWHGVPGIDVFDVELSIDESAKPIALQTSASNKLVFGSLRADTDYHFKLRAHSAASPSLIAGWSSFTPALRCRTAIGWPNPHNAGHDVQNKQSAVGSRLYKVYRWSEGTELVDLLENHNSGDLLGEAVYFTESAHGDDGPNSSTTNSSMGDAWLNRYEQLVFAHL